jgi:glycosyltransferase involved in cell wall biosynthesis
MKILFLGTHFPRPNNPIIGTWALSQVLALRDVGHTVRIVALVPAVPKVIARIFRRGTSANCPPSFSWDGIDTAYVHWPVYPVGPLAKLYRARPDLLVPIGWHVVAGRIRKIVAGFQPDILFAHHGQLGGYVAARIAAERGLPCFVAEHSFGEIESCESNSHRKRHYQSMVQHLVGWIAVSQRLHGSMCKVFPDAPVFTILNGADRIPPTLRATPRPADLTNRLVVLCVSFFYRRKNVPLLISAFDSIADKHPDAILLIVGDGADKAAVEASINAAAHKPQIRLIGSLQHDQVIQYMLWCDVFASVGVNEPFGVVFSEAMMAGKPIVYAADGGISDVVTADTHGLSVKPSDKDSAAAALHRLLSDEALRLRLGAEAAHLAETKLTWAHNAVQLASLFDTAVNRRPTIS